MGPWFVPAYVGKIKIEGDEQTIVGANAFPHLLIRRSRQSLLIDPIGIVACLTQEVDVRKRKVLVELDGETHRSGRISSSRASVAA